jgi:hypothetical protein
MPGQFSRLPLVERDVKFRQLHDVLAAVFDDPQIQLARRHDLLKADSQALWNGRPATPFSGDCGIITRSQYYIGINP